MPANPIPSVSDDGELVRTERLAATYRARLADLGAMRDRLALMGESVAVDARAEALANGAAFEPVRSTESINDECQVIRAAIQRVTAQAVDARAAAVIRITRDSRLPERAAESRAQVALKCHELLAAIDAARELGDAMEGAGLTAAGPRWPGCPAPGVFEAVAGLALETSEGVIDAEAVRELQRKAGIFVEPVFSEAPNRPAPVAVKSLRRKVAETIGELMA